MDKPAEGDLHHDVKPAPPRWVKLFGVVIVVLVVVFAIVHLTGLHKLGGHGGASTMDHEMQHP